MSNNKTLRNSDVFASLGLLLIIIFGYFYFAGSYILTFQETQSLFTFSGKYMHSYMLKPGGLLEYTAKFLTQFYYVRFAGSVILSVILTSPGLVLLFVNRRLIPGISLSLVMLLVPSFLLFLMQANYYHMMEYNLGYLMIVCFYLFSISSGRKYQPIITFILFPLFYYLTGAYAIIFSGMYFVHIIIHEKGSRKYFLSLLMLLVTAITFFIFLKALFLQPAMQLILFPLPLLESTAHKVPFVIITCYLVFYPFLCWLAGKLEQSILNRRLYSLVCAIVFIAVDILLLFRIYNPQTARVIELQRLVFAEKWDEAIRYQENYPSRNLIGQYFYNYALSESDQLCDRLFYGSQDFGAGSLVLPWGDEHLNRGAYFYYSIGLTNEAHRWAYEEMVVYGFRPQNIQMLVKTNLLNGNYLMARKYINILKRTIFYRKRAIEFEKLAYNPDLIKVNPDLGAKLKIIPKTNFFIQFNEPKNNLPIILKSQPDNRKAFEYYIAGFLLTKNVEEIIAHLSEMKEMGYTRIPRHIEEAVMIYYNSKGIMPDLGGLEISRETLSLFDQYFSAYIAARQSPALLREKMQKSFGNTFWFYYHFQQLQN